MVERPLFGSERSRRAVPAPFTRWYTLAMGILIGFSSLGLATESGYQRPPREVLEVLDAPLAPESFPGPTGDWIALATPMSYPTIADLAEPTLRLAGVRINERTNAERSRLFYYTSLSLLRIADGQSFPVELPPRAWRIGTPFWNATGTMIAFTHEAEDCVELWVVDVLTRKARHLAQGQGVNPVLGPAAHWMPDQKHLLVKLLARSGPPPQADAAPVGPRIQESLGSGGASSTYEARDVLKSPLDAARFDYFATSRLAMVDAATGDFTAIGESGVLAYMQVAPGGKYLLVQTVKRPYSYLTAWYRFPREVELWSLTGQRLETLASQPLFEKVPIRGVQTGPRDFFWRPDAPATLMWAEALDGGDPKVEVPHRDVVWMREVGTKARELHRTRERYVTTEWIERGGQALVLEYDPDRHWLHTELLTLKGTKVSTRTLWDLSSDEEYANPGWPVFRHLPSGAWAIKRQGDWIYLSGDGATPDGDRPFLDRLNLKTLKTERLFRSDREHLEQIETVLDAAGGVFLTQRESPTEPPNLMLHTLEAAPLKDVASGEAGWRTTARALTDFRDPVPQLRGISKRLVRYTREDGVELSFVLNLPPGYQEGTRLPTVVWAYPLDYTEKSTAGQVEGSTRQFTVVRGTSALFFLLQGYCVLEQVAMPVVGPAEGAYDTFPEQIVANARAAIDKAVALGVTDPDRVGVMGHSHGALMTANLLIYSDLFRAGIARSGAYNHTIRPFGFQNERRTLWRAKDTYLKLSPVLQADRLDEPLLLIHGELDQNPGTTSQQSEKLYEALRGVGGTVRLAMLPYESHGYIARESVEHVLYEMLTWFDRYVKNAPPRAPRVPPVSSP